MKNHFNQCAKVQYLLNITSLSLALFSNDNNIGNADNGNLLISLIIDNTNIIDRYKNFNIRLFKEALKINGRKPILSTGLKHTRSCNCFKVFQNTMHHVLISCN